MNSKILKRFSIVVMFIMLLVNGSTLFEAYANSYDDNISNDKNFLHEEPDDAGAKGTGGTCHAGGLGAKSCEASASLGGNAGNSGGSLGTGCKVECWPGYYACCNNYENTCKCIKNKS